MFNLFKYLKNFVDLMKIFKAPSEKKDIFFTNNIISYELIIKNFIKWKVNLRKL